MGKNIKKNKVTRKEGKTVLQETKIITGKNIGRWYWASGIIFFLFSLIADVHVIKFFESIRFETLNNVMLWLTNGLTVVLVLIVMTSLFSFEEKKQRWIFPIWLSALTALGVALLISYVFVRLRPYDAIGITSLAVEDTFSFPSKHTAMTFATLPLLDREFKRLKMFWVAFAVLIGISRIYVGVHYLSDVVFGAILGLSVGKSILWGKERCWK